MKIELQLQCGDTIAIPDGCKATIKDGSVVIEKKEQDFEDGGRVKETLRNYHEEIKE